MRIFLNESQLYFLIEAASLDDIYQKYYSNIDKDIFNKIITSDPTYNNEKKNKMGKYGKWLLNLYQKNNLKIEDLYKATNYLTYFDKYQRFLKDKDINHYKTLPELYSNIKEYIDNQDKYLSNSEIEKNIKHDAEKVYEDDNWIIIIPHSKEASCYYGKGTQWCTAAEHSTNYFDDYNSQGNLYININKITGDKYQFHFQTDSFMDDSDNPIEAPIAENIELSNGALNWYKNNVQDSNKLTSIVKDLLVSDDYELRLKKDEDELYWTLYDEMNNYTLAYNLIADDIDIERNSYKLFNLHYCAFENSKKLLTLITYDYDNDSFYLIDNSLKGIQELEREYGDNSDVLLQCIDNENKISIIDVNTTIDLYKTKKSHLIKNIKEISSNIFAVFKYDNTLDIFDIYENEIDDLHYDLKNSTIKSDGDYIYIYDNGELEYKIQCDDLDLI